METYIVLDLETTGISPEFEVITEIGGARISHGEVVETFSELVNPGKSIPANIVAITGITDEMVAKAPSIEEVLPKFIDFCGDLPILGHNVAFDYSFLKTAAKKLGLSYEKYGLDTLVLSRALLERQKSYSLSNLISALGIHRENAHRGLDDALATGELYERLKEGYMSPDHSKYFEPKPITYRPKKQSAVTAKQIKFLNGLIKQHKVEIDYVVETLTKSDASKKIDKILHTYGRKVD